MKLPIIAAISIAFLPVPVIANSYSPTLSTQETQNIFCARNFKSGVTRVSKSPLPEGYADLKDVQLTSDFRFRKKKKDIPFSKALAFNDPVTGQFVGVMDQNFVPGGSKVMSSWTRYVIGISGYWAYGKGNYISYSPFEANILWIPDGDSYLVVKGCNGRFTVTPEVAKALYNSAPGKNAYIRFSAEGTGSAVLSEIGKGTVEAWKKIYATWKPGSPTKIESLGF